MNLNQLRYVKAVAETGSFTLAAEQCYVTQPTLSNGIARLEQELEERIDLLSSCKLCAQAPRHLTDTENSIAFLL